ncbi:phosphodiester glycosidase family protein [Paenibacillus thiaminolyticus]|uniref:phosphodiester glycosidase family protein n=1 Tax=Paenibacillus thiaminolyticus TaxID=49283 RepID=UPI0023306317|nr:phosphodiester glycosidase family protein [Paenibacillus thiaminolyticus]WCF08264.1 phosphodiester glycosidase family protein [Paenibacillus thiaminolyticus]
MSTAKYFKTAHNSREVRVIEADPEAIGVEKISGSVVNSDKYGVNGTFFNSNNDFLGVAVNKGTGVGGNATYNAYGNKRRGTFYSYQNQVSNIRVQEAANVTKFSDYPTFPNSNYFAIGGLNLYANADIDKQEFYRRLDVNEEASTINDVINKRGNTYYDPTLRARTAIGYNSNGKIILAVFRSETPWGMREFMRSQKCYQAVYLDGGGSSQMRYKEGRSSGSFDPTDGKRPVYNMVTVNPTSWA